MRIPVILYGNIILGRHCPPETQAPRSPMASCMQGSLKGTIFWTPWTLYPEVLSGGILWVVSSPMRQSLMGWYIHRIMLLLYVRSMPVPAPYGGSTGTVFFPLIMGITPARQFTMGWFMREVLMGIYMRSIRQPVLLPGNMNPLV